MLVGASGGGSDDALPFGTWALLAMLAGGPRSIDAWVRGLLTIAEYDLGPLPGLFPDHCGGDAVHLSVDWCWGGNSACAFAPAARSGRGHPDLHRTEIFISSMQTKRNNTMLVPFFCSSWSGAADQGRRLVPVDRPRGWPTGSICRKFIGAMVSIDTTPSRR